MRIWDVERGQEVGRVDGRDGMVKRATVLPDGHRVLWTEGYGLHMWDLNAKQEIRRFALPDGSTGHFAVSGDGRRIIMGGSDGINSVYFYIWDSDSDKILRKVPGWGGSSLALSEDGKRAVSNANENLHSCDVETGTELQRISVPELHFGIVAISPDGRLVAGGSGPVYVWDAATGREYCRFEEPVHSVEVVGFAPQGNQIIYGSVNGNFEVTIRDLPSLEQTRAPTLNKSTAKNSSMVSDPASSEGPNVDVANGKSDATSQPKSPELTPGPKKPDPPAEAEKFDAADVAALTAARKQVMEDFKNAFLATEGPKDKRELAGKLLAESLKSKEASGRRFALLEAAAQMSAQADDLAFALNIVDDLAKEYPTAAREAKIRTLQAATTSLSSQDIAKTYLDAAVPLLEEARATDEYDSVAPLLQAVKQAASGIADRALAKSTITLVGQLERLQKDYDAVKPAVAVLKAKPDDADACTALGQFYCFQKQDWDKGLPLLAKGGNARLSDVAQKELTPPAEAADQVKLGDAWDAVAKTTPAYHAMMQSKACQWYLTALPNLADKEKDRVEKLVIDLTPSIPGMHSAWDELDLAGAKAIAVADAYLKLGPNHTLSTKHTFAGPVEITLEFRTTKKPPRLALQRTKEILFECEITDKSLTMLRPSDIARGKAENLIFPHEFSFEPYTWYSITCRVEEKGTEALLAGNSVFTDAHAHDLSKAKAFQVVSGDQPLEIKTFTVKPLNP